MWEEAELRSDLLWDSPNNPGYSVAALLTFS